MGNSETHCDCIKTPGGIRGFGAWCKDHHRLLDDYEFQKAKADEVVRRYGELEAENARLNMEMVAYRQALTPKDVEAMTAVIKALNDEKAARSQSAKACVKP